MDVQRGGAAWRSEQVMNMTEQCLTFHERLYARRGYEIDPEGNGPPHGPD